MSHRQYVAGKVSPKGIKYISITSATTFSTVSWTNYLRQESFLHIVFYCGKTDLLERLNITTRHRIGYYGFAQSDLQAG